MTITPNTLRMSRRTTMKLTGAAGLAAMIGQPHLRTVVAQSSTPAAEGEAVVVVGDVEDFTLDPEGRWEGGFGSVTLRMHPGFFEGGDAWFIRTDASDQAFAQEHGLVHVPLLANALDADGAYGHIYLFDGGDADQRPVVNRVPGDTTYTPAFRVHNVSVGGDAGLLDSEAAIEQAEADGTVTVEPTDIVVNYPLVSWPDGALPVDPDLVDPLGPGALIEEPDLENGLVTFKLHQCYPGSRYIATDTSAAPMAPMMGVAASEATQALLDAGATAPIYVFMPGLPGPAAMGSQPSIFNVSAGHPDWSPFWDHITVAWNEGVEPRVLTSEEEVLAAEEAGEVTLYKGTPDTDPNGFVVNCPAPVLAPVSYDPADWS
ncbi:MAG: hypothetical protein M3173_08960 [Chloroflexota bacterium]|nr:hypothetical protein [Chloroflexota bacterium]